MLKKTDYVGWVSDSQTDKSQVFEYIMGSVEAEVPLVMEYSLLQIYILQTS